MRGERGRIRCPEDDTRGKGQMGRKNEQERDLDGRKFTLGENSGMQGHNSMLHKQL